MAHPASFQHERFYFSDGNLKLQVVDTVYLVHSYLFTMHAHTFPPVVTAMPNVGHYKPHILENVERIDFDRLLACLYPRELMVEEARSPDEWTSILKLASKWGFESLYKRAVKEIDSLASPIDKVVLGREYGISELLFPGYLALCQSRVPLSEEEGEQLGLKDVIKIYRVRQESWGQDGRAIASENLLAKVRTWAATVARPPSAQVPTSLLSYPSSPPEIRCPPSYVPRPSSPKILHHRNYSSASRADTGSWVFTDPDRSPSTHDVRLSTPSPGTSIDVPQPILEPPLEVLELGVPLTTAETPPSIQAEPSKKKKKGAVPNPNPPVGKKKKAKAEAASAQQAQPGGPSAIV